mmetsp:Transcript_2677/g.3581  ORF Transcript_2677/g.3581 Transcript_2677/m.3581 type:complete len:403 (+) Transcript_2677:156-1364(+)
MSGAETAVSASSSWMLDFVTKWIMRFGSFSVGIVALLGGLLYVKQESLLYLPSVQGIPRHNRDNPKGFQSPKDRGLEHWFNVRIPTVDNAHIHAWYLIHPGALEKDKKVPTLIFFHGNAGNIGLRLPNACQMMQQLSCNILLVEYRGYGDSDDHLPPSEIGLKRDAQAAYEWIVNAGAGGDTGVATVTPSSQELADNTVSYFIDSSQLYLFGRSLGGAVAFSLASYIETQSHCLPRLAGLVVENTFTGISAMADKLLPFLKPIKSYVLRMDWNNQQAATTLVQTPILYLAGALDDLVPHQQMKDLYQTSMLAGNPRVTMHIVPNGTHNETWYQGGTEYWKAIRAFLSQTKKLPMNATPKSSININMEGQETSAIPTMSSKIMDMAKEALSSSNASAGKDKKS